MDNKMINELAEYIMAHGTIVEHALANRDKQMLVEALKDFNPNYVENTYSYYLSFNDYIGNAEKPSRKISFGVPENWIKFCLGIKDDPIKDEDIARLLDEDIEQIYNGALDNGVLMDKNIEYCDEFEEDFANFVRKLSTLNQTGLLYSKETKEIYYDNVFCLNKLMEQQSDQKESEEEEER